MSVVPRLTVVIRDAKGATSEFGLYSEKLDLADYENGATLEAMADNILQDLEPVIDGQIVEAYWKLPVDLDFTPQAPAANSDVEEGAKFIWKTERGFKVEARIPTFKESLFLSGTRFVNVASSAVQDFNNTIIDGPDALTGVEEDRFNMTDNRGEDITELDVAFESFIGSKKPKI